MTEFDSEATVARLHDLLLSLAGRMPDELISEARQWLAAGRAGDVVQALAFGAAAAGTALTAAEIDDLAAVPDPDGDLGAMLAGIPRALFEPVTRYAMAPVPPEQLTGDDTPAALDLTGDDTAALDLTGDGDHPYRMDEIDRVAARTAAATGTDRLVGVWRAWRYPAGGSPWPRPRRIFVVEAGAEVPPARLPTIAATLQAALTAAGEAFPQVEVVAEAVDVPVYQAVARGHGALLWAPAPAVGIRNARPFDEVDPETGPAFAADHPRLTGDEAGQILEYLTGGTTLFYTDALMPDVLDPAGGDVVPLNLLTDGTWIWSDASAHYLRRHGLAPDPGLVEHIRAAGYLPPYTDTVALHRAMLAVLDLGDEEPAWTVG